MNLSSKPLLRLPVTMAITNYHALREGVLYTKCVQNIHTLHKEGVFLAFILVLGVASSVKDKVESIFISMESARARQTRPTLWRWGAYECVFPPLFHIFWHLRPQTQQACLAA